MNNTVSITFQITLISTHMIDYLFVRHVNEMSFDGHIQVKIFRNPPNKQQQKMFHANLSIRFINIVISPY